MVKGLSKIQVAPVGGWQQHEREWGTHAVRWGVDARGTWWGKIVSLDDLTDGVVDEVVLVGAWRRDVEADVFQSLARRVTERVGYTPELERCARWCLRRAKARGLSRKRSWEVHQVIERWKAEHDEHMGLPTIRA